ncbi:flagellar assembly protein FliW [Thermoclostridium stercorarium]|uniref:flagellar assembly protein FliW n=1 Tax=Thermoclostridium stercorarium TaxID=1510 RepID=UPI0004ACA3B8|nr:flagellar assembly protein FliW [Thermoclostridium stercorarium]UZQ85473.1 flagellar assembly protein FliW [Thermoclostridium stercorarium]
MQLNTKHFGVIEVDEKEILYFPSGIPGFENVRKFVLLERQEADSPFFWLQCVDKPDLAFVVTDPFYIKEDYYVDVDDEEIAEIEINDPENVLTLAIVTIPEDIRFMTVNLKAPVLINMKNNMGKQVIMKNDTFPVRYYILTGGSEPPR